MKSFPEIVTFRITSRCNNNCEYCYGPQKNLDELDFSKLKQLFHLFGERGVKAVVLTGGEPLIREDFEDIIKELKERGIKIFLDTNGDLFFKYSDIITENVDVIGLPIDFPNNTYRNSNNLENIVKVLDFFKNRENKPIIRIGTVVTKDNIGELDKIGDFIKDYNIDIWKIYEFVPQNTNAIKNKSLLEVLPQEFDQASQNAKDKFSDCFKITISKRNERTNAYFFVSSDGNVFMPVDNLDICNEIPIGNVFDEDIVDKWERIVSEDKYQNNVMATFNYGF